MLQRMAAGLLLACIVRVLYLAWTRLGGRPDAAALERLLLAQCLGDRGQMERLVGYDLERAPDIDTYEAMRRALDRLARDRR